MSHPENTSRIICNRINKPSDGFEKKQNVHLKTQKTKYKPGQKVWYKTHKNKWKWKKNQINQILRSFCNKIINYNYVCKQHQDQLQAKVKKDKEKKIKKSKKSRNKKKLKIK